MPVHTLNGYRDECTIDRTYTTFKEKVEVWIVLDNRWNFVVWEVNFLIHFAKSLQHPMNAFVYKV